LFSFKIYLLLNNFQIAKHRRWCGEVITTAVWVGLGAKIFGWVWFKLAATLRWFTAGGAIRIALRQLSQTWKLRHYDVIADVITRKL